MRYLVYVTFEPAKETNCAKFILGILICASIFSFHICSKY